MASQTICDACGKVITGGCVSVRWERSGARETERRCRYGQVCDEFCEAAFFAEAAIQARVEPVKVSAERARRERETGYATVVEALNAQIVAAKRAKRGRR